MSNRTFSLFHQVAPPKGGLESKPPLLLLLHGYGANEDDLFSLAPYLDERFMIVSARAPIMLQPMSYAEFINPCSRVCVCARRLRLRTDRRSGSGKDTRITIPRGDHH